MRPSSEGIAHAEVECRIAPLEVVNPPLPCRIVGVVKLDAPVQPQHGELDVKPDSQSRVESQLLVEITDMEYGLRRVLRCVVAHEPDVADIEEGRPVKNPPDRKAQFEIGLQLHVSQLYGVGYRSGIDIDRTGAQHAGNPSSHAVAAAAIEQTVEGNGGRIAVCQPATRIEPARNGGLLSQHDFAARTQIDAEVLGVTYSEDFVVVFPFCRR